MKFLAALAALVAAAQAAPQLLAARGVIGYSGTPLAANGLPVGHVVPGPQVVGAVAQGPNVLPSRAALPGAYTIEEAPIVNHHVEPVEQWALSINF
jgi:hypothetical protein